MQISAKPVGRPYTGQAESDIVEASLGRSGLRVLVETYPHDTDARPGTEFLFEVARGFRYLDEGDLLAYWQSKAFASGHRLFEIEAGGWLDQERQQTGMLSTTDAVGSFREWFICTSNGCMNVLSVNEPLIREFNNL
ncbi:hypothetical protein ACS5PN_27455 [Roseateles sp. NT4]|uniref:hypothetical protein n=1 Tax=Roseateles sp. NT4 TaxID=3453715 RepID=UPI003EEA6966